MIPHFAYSYAEPVTLSVDFRANQVGFWVGTTGTVTVKFGNGSSASFVAVPAGTELRVQCKQITAAPANTLVLYE